ncbi:flavin reductase [Trujillonella endophytica]|uniref:NADH-FMN oxidoreductase RutF, flavin reductase (DIM6/NTAB) family n=1 Tax=Trujillonella endophytica TaxID=673521 RepID=A0A1H8QS30_9ACTN|nr:flavin reductase [Trujillella endophytica]SEO56837.1 NADH-FMN oxidoreductase RutF, flavin reductase (DIM6/NTAB) family [Trujillella endophytica]
MTHEFTAQQFRQVLGQYPTGVVVVTATIPGAPPAALTIGSFSSVSLDPPLVAFYPGKDSSTWPKIQAQGRFCINVLGADQEALCRAFATKGADKFAGVAWHPAPSGAPIINGAVAWIDCEMEDVLTLGDHYLVVGHVTALETESQDLPLLFFRGGYGRFLPSSLAASESSLAEFLPVVEAVRAELESVARDCGSECNLAAQIRDEFVVLAGAGAQASPRGKRPTRVGRRLPYLAPIGAPLAAWGDPADLDRWVSPVSDASVDGLERWQDTLDVIRRRGYVIGRGDTPYAAMENAIDERTGRGADPALLSALVEVRKTMLDQPSIGSSDDKYDVRSLTVPIFLPAGRVVQMGLYGLQADMSSDTLRRCVRRLLQASWRCTESLGGEMPAGFPLPGTDQH